MATIKAYTDIEQSKKLAEILQHKSADMCYLSEESLVPKVIYSGMIFFDSKKERPTNIIHCWSLAALLGVLPKIHKLKPILDLEECSIQYSGIDLYITANNPVDACYEMILKLHELNLL